MASRTKNITIDQGSDYSQSFTVYSSPSATAKLDLTTLHHANAQMRKSSLHTNSAITFNTSISTSADTITLKANNIVTRGIKSGRYLYEVVVTDRNVSPATKTRVLEGIATVTPSVEVGSMYTTNSTGGDGSSNYN
jgi:hypothetical protein